MQIPDFEPAGSLNATLEITPKMLHKKHSLEYVYEVYRAQQDPKVNMTEESLLLTNFPSSVNVTEEYLRQLVAGADTSALISSIQIQSSLAGSSPEASIHKTAYAIVNFQNTNAVESVKRGLNKHWIQDKLLKTRQMKDMESEKFDDRTIIIQDIASFYNTQDLVNDFHEFGAILSVEVPTVPRDSIKEDSFIKESQKQKEIEYRHSQQVFKESVEQFDNQIEDVLTQTYGADQAKEKMQSYTQFNMVDKEKVDGFVRVMMELGSESIQVQNSKATIANLQTTPTTDAIGQKQNQIQGMIKYLVSNKEALDDSQSSFVNNLNQKDAVHTLQRMSLAELTNAYDFLHSMLLQREKLIKLRIKESLKHYGKDERVLFESGDMNRELETIPDILANVITYDQHSIDQILGVNEQVQHIQFKLSPEEKLYQFMTDTANYLGKKNFDKLQLAYANTDKLDLFRDHVFPSTQFNISQVREDKPYPIRPFKDEELAHINTHVQRAQDNFQTPFDEIYHKERKVVQDLVNAETALRDAYDALPNPLAFRAETNQKTQYENDRSTSDNAAGHIYSESKQNTINDKINLGQINKNEYLAAQEMKELNKHTNLGYALITFSHADEAKQALIKTDGQMIIQNNFVTVMPKGSLDHSQLDQSYFMRKMKNESKIIDKKENLRLAKTNLKDFERNIDNEIPSGKQLQDFKSVIQELIENPIGKTRRHKSQRRTKRETEQLYQKLRTYQSENPSIDMTNLFESYQADQIRKLKHKRAFNTYKNVEFLKAGVNQKEELGQQLDAYEPFNYPGLKDSVASVFTDGNQLRVRDAGERMSNRQRGRKFSQYSEQEFLESYLGKDYLRMPDLSQDEYNQTFSFQQSLKEMFPDKTEFLKYPKLKADQEKLKEFMGLTQRDGEAADPLLQQYVQGTFDGGKLNQEMALGPENDQTHPKDPKRTKMGDLKILLEEMQAKMDKNGIKGDAFETMMMDPKQKTLKKMFRRLDQMGYNNPFEVDEKNRNLNRTKAHLEKYEAQMEKVGEYLDQADEQFKNAPTDQDLQMITEKEIIKEGSKLDKPGRKFSDWVAENSAPQRQQRPDRGSNFEDQSMFDPIADEGEVNTKLSQRQKNNNNNVYNVQHMYNNQNTDYKNQQHHAQYAEMAKQVTDQRRQQFDQMKAEQMSLSEEDRTPHFINDNGVPEPYSQQFLDQKRQEALEIHNKNLVQMKSFRANNQEEIIQERLQQAQSQKEIDDIKSKIRNGELVPESDENFLNLGLVDIFSFDSKTAIADITIPEMLKLVKDKTNVKGLFNEERGMFRYQDTEMDEQDIATHNYRENISAGRTLDNFTSEQAKNETIGVKHDAADIQRQLKLQQLQEEAMKDQTPSFQSFFNNQSKNGGNVFDDFSQDEGQSEDIEQTKEEYRQELLARMFDGQLTARQYGVLTNMADENDQDQSKTLKAAQEHKNQVDARDKIRNHEEMLESHRRKMVMTGKWTEQSSHHELQQMLEDFHNKYPTDSAWKIARREYKKQLENRLGNETSEQVQEREYYFDEGLGQTLQDHIKSLKSEFPTMEVKTRRDRDGLAIVQMSMQNQFKYKLDNLLNSDPEQLQNVFIETQEAIVNKFGIEDALQNNFATQEQAQKMESLVEERLYGKYKSDIEGFLNEYTQIKNMKSDSPLFTTPSSTKGSPTPFTVLGNSQVSNLAFQSLMSEKEQIDLQLSYQMKLKQNDHKYMTERKKSDFVKPIRNDLYRQNFETIDGTKKLLERDNEWMIQNQQRRSNGNSQ